MTPEMNIDNDVNDSIQSSERVAFVRGGNKASSVVIQRNPCKEKEKTEKGKERLKVGIWNVRTMRRPGKLTNVIGEMKKAGLNILGLSEVRWKDAGEFMSEGVRVIYTGGEESQNGIAILLVARCIDG